MSPGSDRVSTAREAAEGAPCPLYEPGIASHIFSYSSIIGKLLQLPKAAFVPNSRVNATPLSFTNRTTMQFVVSPGVEN